MDPRNREYREVTVPVSLLGTVRRHLAREAGSLPAIHALHAAGYDAGTEALDALRASGDGDLGELPEEAFWSRVTTFFSRRGWGTLRVATEHPAVGLLMSANWAESASPGGEEAACSFTSGFLSGLLSRVAGGPIAVLEVACRGRSDDRCCFAFGSESAIHELYGRLMEDGDLERALAGLQPTP